MITLNGSNLQDVRKSEISLMKIDSAWSAAGHTCEKTVAGALTCAGCAKRKIAKPSTERKGIRHDEGDRGTMRMIAQAFVDAGVPVPDIYAEWDPEFQARREAREALKAQAVADAKAQAKGLTAVAMFAECLRAGLGDDREAFIYVHGESTKREIWTSCDFHNTGDRDVEAIRNAFTMTTREGGEIRFEACETCTNALAPVVAVFNASKRATVVEAPRVVEVVATVEASPVVVAAPALTAFQRERIERAEDRAVALARKAERLEARGDSLAEGIPFGQPIILGHHSERRDRAYRERIHATYSAAHDARIVAQSAADVAANAGQIISSDDPEAVEALTAKLAKLEGDQAKMKRANPLAKRGDVDGLIAMGFSAKVATALTLPDFAGRIGFAPYMLTNNAANMKRILERLATLERAKVASVMTTITGDGWEIREDRDDARIAVKFDAKPSPEILEALRSRGFKWSPSRGYHVRQITDNARRDAREIAAKIKALAPVVVEASPVEALKDLPVEALEGLPVEALEDPSVVVASVVETFEASPVECEQDAIAVEFREAVRARQSGVDPLPMTTRREPAEPERKIAEFEALPDPSSPANVEAIAQIRAEIELRGIAEIEAHSREREAQASDGARCDDEARSWNARRASEFDGDGAGVVATFEAREREAVANATTIAERERLIAAFEQVRDCREVTKAKARAEHADREAWVDRETARMSSLIRSETATQSRRLRSGVAQKSGDT